DPYCLQCRTDASRVPVPTALQLGIGGAVEDFVLAHVRRLGKIKNSLFRLEDAFSRVGGAKLFHRLLGGTASRGLHFGVWVQRGPPRSRRERPPVPCPWPAKMGHRGICIRLQMNPADTSRD